MSLTTIEKKSASVLRLVPSAEQQTAVGALLGCAVCLGFVGVLMNGITLARFAVLYLCIIFVTVGVILRRQQRVIEISLQDECIYFLGRRKQDVYSIPFGMISALCLTKRTSTGELVSNIQRSESEQNGREPFHLDLMLHDSGYETLDRSVLGPDLAATALAIADMTGFGIEDHAGVGFSRAPKTEYPALDGHGNTFPPVTSVLHEFTAKGRSGFEWTLSPGWLYISLMALAASGLLYGGGYGVYKASYGEGSMVAGVILLGVCGFFAYMIIWRLVRAVAGKGFVAWDDETIQFGARIFGKEYQSVLLELRDVKTIRVAVPRAGRGSVEVVQHSGKILQAVGISSPLASLTSGDVHWLGNFMRHHVAVAR